eukprot:Gb_39117 [translate_table: standard]
MVVIMDGGVDCEGKKRKRRPVLCRGECRTWISRGGEKFGVNSSDEDNSTRKRSLVEIYERCSPVLNDTVKECGKKRGRKKLHENVVCKECGEGKGDKDLLLCSGCGNGYHMYCLCPISLRTARGKWFCPACSGKDCISGTRIFSMREKLVIYGDRLFPSKQGEVNQIYCHLNNARSFENNSSQGLLLQNDFMSILKLGEKPAQNS